MPGLDRTGDVFRLDFRVMRSDHGFWCLPESNLGAIKRRMYATVHTALLDDAVRY